MKIYKYAKRILLTALLLTGMIIFPPAMAADSTSVFAPTASFLPTALCLTKFTESASLNNFFTPLTSQANVGRGGLLCPGTYNARVICSVFTGSCGGSKCGWNLNVSSYYYQGPSAGTNQLKSTGSTIIGCEWPPGYICEWQGNITITFQDFIYDATNSYLWVTGFVEGGVHLCTISVERI